MRSIPRLTLLCASLGTTAFAAFQAQPPITTIGTLPGIDVVNIAPALGTARLYIEGDSALWMYDRATNRTTLVARGELWDPTVSPAADRIAFGRSSEDGKGEHIWSMPLDPKTGLAAGPARRVSMTQGDVPAFSPDGKLIAFGRDSLGGQHLTVVSSSGGPERVLARLPGGIGRLRWLPDGNSIYFTLGQSAAPRGPRAFSVQRVSSAGGRAELVMQTSGAGSLSPDGRLLLTSSGGPAHRRYVISDPMGKKLGEFTLPAGQAPSAWTGPTTVVTTASLAPTTITAVSLADGRRRSLTEAPGQATTLKWSPDGRRIAFLQPADQALVVMNGDGSGKKTFRLKHEYAISTSAETPLRWSPNGLSILYLGVAEGAISSSRVIDIATGREREVLSTGVRVEWMSDSRRFFYTKNLDRDSSATPARFKHELHIASLDGGDRVMRELTTNCGACFWPIGDSAVVFGRREGTSIASLRTNEPPRQLFPGENRGHSNPAISPDGRWVAFHDIDAATNGSGTMLDVMRVDGSDRRRIELPVRRLIGPGHPTFTSDSRELLILGRSNPNEIEVYRLALTGGDVRKVLTLADAPGATIDYSISPDGKTLVYAAAGERSTRLSEINLAGLLGRRPAGAPKR